MSSVSFALQPNTFESWNYFETSVLNDAKMTLNSEHYKVKLSIYLVTIVSQVPNFCLFRSTTSNFQVTGHYETSVPNDCKMTLHATLPHYCAPHICPVSVPKFQSILFYSHSICRCSFEASAQ